MKKAIIEPDKMPIAAKINAINGPNIAVPARIVSVLGIGIKTTCNRLIIV